ncbi:hypothetical protein V5F72_20950 [Xanthobacter flavus]|uniref:hypothetical protein n=1 Tax=Xanthobacter flavus TaxID=281 RepID=UPI00372B823D
MPPGPLMEGGLRRPPPSSGITPLAYTRLSYRGAIRSETEARAVARRLGRRAPIGFGDPPRAEARLAPLFLAGGVLAALLIAFLRSL